MTRRILASFLLVLAVTIALIEIPLGVELAGHERADFRQTTSAAVRSLAAAAEERLGDAQEQSSGAGLHLDVDRGDAVAIANRRGELIAQFGPRLPAGMVRAVLAGRRVATEDRTLATARVGDDGQFDGTVVLARSSQTLDDRLGELTAALVLAACAALALGAAVAVGLARWVARPVEGLRRAATAMGAGDLTVQAAAAGPPEVRELAADFNLMAKRVGDLLDDQRAMMSDVSHQLRTPLAAVRLRMENLLAEAPSALRPDVAGSLDEINRLSRLADGLLAVARAEQAPSRPQPVAVADVIAERVALWQSLADEREVRLVNAADPVTALAGRGHLEQILDNLLANALEAVPTGSQIELVARRDQDRVLVNVTDHGPGMPRAARGVAFQRFSGVGDPNARSAGLGLSIVGSLVKANHGDARLDETPGGGLTVTLQLPVAAAV
jgi:signal transduction histidine kinase